MGCFAKFKCFFFSFALFYVVYLLTYKCPKLHESALDHAAQKLVHPFSHQHDQLCLVIELTEKFTSPYLAQAHGFLDRHVHSHRLFKEYKVEAKMNLLKSHYYAHVYPHVLKFWAYVELLEYHLAVRSNQLYRYLESHFHKTVEPKIRGLKETVVAQAETIKSQVKSKIE